MGTAVADKATMSGTRRAYLDLRAIHTVDVQGWARFGGADLGKGPGHVAMDLPGGVRRVLTRDEVFWWAAGLGDAHHHGDQVHRLNEEETPDLVTLPAAGLLLPGTSRRGQAPRPMTLQGVQYHIQAGLFYVVHAADAPRTRHLFAAQVRAQAAVWAVEAAAGDGSPARRVAALRVAAETAAGVWDDLVRRLPPQTPLPTPVPAPRRGAGALPIPVDQSADRRGYLALQIAHTRGWLEFLHPTVLGYAVRVGDVVRDLPTAGVLPWVLGVADRHGKGRLVAYRAGLG